MEDYDPACPTEDDILPEIDLSQVPLPPPLQSETKGKAKSSSPPVLHTEGDVDEEEGRKGRKKKKKKKRKGQERTRPDSEYLNEGEDDDDENNDTAEAIRPRSRDPSVETERLTPADSLKKNDESDPPVRQPQPAQEPKRQPQPVSEMKFRLKTDPTSGKAKVSFHIKKTLRSNALMNADSEEEEGEELEPPGKSAEDEEDITIMEKSTSGEVVPVRFKVAKKHEMFRPDMLSDSTIVVDVPPVNLAIQNSNVLAGIVKDDNTDPAVAAATAAAAAVTAVVSQLEQEQAELDDNPSTESPIGALSSAVSGFEKNDDSMITSSSQQNDPAVTELEDLCNQKNMDHSGPEKMVMDADDGRTKRSSQRLKAREANDSPQSKESEGQSRRSRRSKETDHSKSRLDDYEESRQSRRSSRYKDDKGDTSRSRLSSKHYYDSPTREQPSRNTRGNRRNRTPSRERRRRSRSKSPKVHAREEKGRSRKSQGDSETNIADDNIKQRQDEKKPSVSRQDISDDSSRLEKEETRERQKRENEQKEDDRALEKNLVVDSVTADSQENSGVSNCPSTSEMRSRSVSPNAGFDLPEQVLDDLSKEKIDEEIQHRKDKSLSPDCEKDNLKEREIPRLNCNREGDDREEENQGLDQRNNKNEKESHGTHSDDNISGKESHSPDDRKDKKEKETENTDWRKAKREKESQIPNTRKEKFEKGSPSPEKRQDEMGKDGESTESRRAKREKESPSPNTRKDKGEKDSPSPERREVKEGKEKESRKAKREKESPSRNTRKDKWKKRSPSPERREDKEGKERESRKAKRDKESPSRNAGKDKREKGSLSPDNRKDKKESEIAESRKSKREKESPSPNMRKDKRENERTDSRKAKREKSQSPNTRKDKREKGRYSPERRKDKIEKESPSPNVRSKGKNKKGQSSYDGSEDEMDTKSQRKGSSTKAAPDSWNSDSFDSSEEMANVASPSEDSNKKKTKSNKREKRGDKASVRGKEIQEEGVISGSRDQRHKKAVVRKAASSQPSDSSDSSESDSEYDKPFKKTGNPERRETRAKKDEVGSKERKWKSSVSAREEEKEEKMSDSRRFNWREKAKYEKSPKSKEWSSKGRDKRQRSPSPEQPYSSKSDIIRREETGRTRREAERRSPARDKQFLGGEIFVDISAIPGKSKWEIDDEEDGGKTVDIDELKDFEPVPQASRPLLGRSLRRPTEFQTLRQGSDRLQRDGRGGRFTRWSARIDETRREPEEVNSERDSKEKKGMGKEEKRAKKKKYKEVDKDDKAASKKKKTRIDLDDNADEPSSRDQEPLVDDKSPTHDTLMESASRPESRSSVHGEEELGESMRKSREDPKPEVNDSLSQRDSPEHLSKATSTISETKSKELDKESLLLDSKDVEFDSMKSDNDKTKGKQKEDDPLSNKSSDTSLMSEKASHQSSSTLISEEATDSKADNSPHQETAQKPEDLVSRSRRSVSKSSSKSSQYSHSKRDRSRSSERRKEVIRASGLRERSLSREKLGRQSGSDRGRDRSLSKERRRRRSSSKQRHREHSASMERDNERSVLQEKGKERSISKERRKGHFPSKERRRDRSASTERRRDHSPSKGRRRDHSPSKDRRRDHSPLKERRRGRSTSKERRKGRSSSKERRKGQSSPKERRRGRSVSKERSRDSSVSNEKRRYTSRSPEGSRKGRSRSRSGDRNWRGSRRRSRSNEHRTKFNRSYQTNYNRRDRSRSRDGISDRRKADSKSAENSGRSRSSPNEKSKIASRKKNPNVQSRSSSSESSSSSDDEIIRVEKAHPAKETPSVERKATVSNSKDVSPNRLRDEKTANSSVDIDLSSIPVPGALSMPADVIDGENKAMETSAQGDSRCQDDMVPVEMEISDEENEPGKIEDAPEVKENVSSHTSIAKQKDNIHAGTKKAESSQSTVQTQNKLATESKGKNRQIKFSITGSGQKIKPALVTDLFDDDDADEKDREKKKRKALLCDFSEEEERRPSLNVNEELVPETNSDKLTQPTNQGLAVDSSLTGEGAVAVDMNDVKDSFNLAIPKQTSSEKDSEVITEGEHLPMLEEETSLTKSPTLVEGTEKASKPEVKTESPPKRLKFKYVPLWQMEGEERPPARSSVGGSNNSQTTPMLGLDYSSNSSDEEDERTGPSPRKERKRTTLLTTDTSTPDETVGRDETSCQSAPAKTSSISQPGLGLEKVVKDSTEYLISAKDNQNTQSKSVLDARKEEPFSVLEIYSPSHPSLDESTADDGHCPDIITASSGHIPLASPKIKSNEDDTLPSGLETDTPSKEHPLAMSIPNSNAEPSTNLTRLPGIVLEAQKLERDASSQIGDINIEAGPSRHIPTETACAVTSIVSQSQIRPSPPSKLSPVEVPSVSLTGQESKIRTTRFDQGPIAMVAPPQTVLPPQSSGPCLVDLTTFSEDNPSVTGTSVVDTSSPFCSNEQKKKRADFPSAESQVADQFSSTGYVKTSSSGGIFQGMKKSKKLVETIDLTEVSEEQIFEKQTSRGRRRKSEKFGETIDLTEMAEDLEKRPSQSSPSRSVKSSIKISPASASVSYSVSDIPMPCDTSVKPKPKDVQPPIPAPPTSSPPPLPPSPPPSFNEHNQPAAPSLSPLIQNNPLPPSSPAPEKGESTANNPLLNSSQPTLSAQIAVVADALSSEGIEKKKRFSQSPLAIGMLPKPHTQSPLAIGMLPKIVPTPGEKLSEGRLSQKSYLIPDSKTKTSLDLGNSKKTESSQEDKLPAESSPSNSTPQKPPSRFHFVFKNKAAVPKTVASAFGDEDSDSGDNLGDKSKTSEPAAMSVETLVSSKGEGEELEVTKDMVAISKDIMQTVRELANQIAEPRQPVTVITSSRQVEGQSSGWEWDALAASNQTKVYGDISPEKMVEQVSVELDSQREMERDGHSRVGSDGGGNVAPKRKSRFDVVEDKSGSSDQSRDRHAGGNFDDPNTMKIKQEKEDDYGDSNQTRKQDDEEKSRHRLSKGGDERPKKRSRHDRDDDRRRRRVESEDSEEDRRSSRTYAGSRRSQERDRDRIRERDRTRDRDGSRGRDRKMSRDRNRSRERERSWESERRKERERSRERDRGRDWGRDLDRSSSKSGRLSGSRRSKWSSERSRSRSRSPGYRRNRSRERYEKNKSRDGDRERSRSVERKGRSEKGTPKKRDSRSFKEEIMEELGKMDSSFKHSTGNEFSRDTIPPEIPDQLGSLAQYGETEQLSYSHPNQAYPHAHSSDPNYPSPMPNPAFAQPHEMPDTGVTGFAPDPNFPSHYPQNYDPQSYGSQWPPQTSHEQYHSLGSHLPSQQQYPAGMPTESASLPHAYPPASHVQQATFQPPLPPQPAQPPFPQPSAAQSAQHYPMPPQGVPPVSHIPLPPPSEAFQQHVTQPSPSASLYQTSSYGHQHAPSPSQQGQLRSLPPIPSAFLSSSSSSFERPEEAVPHDHLHPAHPHLGAIPLPQFTARSSTTVSSTTTTNFTNLATIELKPSSSILSSLKASKIDGKPPRKSRFSSIHESPKGSPSIASAERSFRDSPTTTGPVRREATSNNNNSTNNSSNSDEPSFENSQNAEKGHQEASGSGSSTQSSKFKDRWKGGRRDSGRKLTNKPWPEDATDTMVTSSGVEDSQGDTGSDSGTDSSQKPLKVKSRWRRNSEAEAVIDTSTSSQLSSLTKLLALIAPAGNLSLSPSVANATERSASPAAAGQESAATVLLPRKKRKLDLEPSVKTDEESGEQGKDKCEDGSFQEYADSTDLATLMKRPDFPKFEIITENIHLTERKRSKSMKRMQCDCTTSRDDRSMGIKACGSDCLNRMLMIECGSRCPCGDYCTNRRFQTKTYSKTCPMKSGDKGWGLKALEDMEESGTFIMEYVGELLDFEEFVRRTKQYSKMGMEHHYFMALNADEVVDATLKGSTSRFINHSCDPNCETQKWTVNGELRVGFFTRKPIKDGEELTFDYQFEHYGEPQKCYCGTEKCRGYIGLVKSPTKSSASKKKDKKKKEIFKDELLEKDISKLSLLDGMRNKGHVLELCRMMVRAEKVHHRVAILKILQETTEPACLRLFLDYHGLPLFWSWMTDVNTTDSDDLEEFKILMLSVLKALPISNRTMLNESKILGIVEKWALQAALAARTSSSTIPPPPPPTSTTSASSKIDAGSSSSTSTSSSSSSASLQSEETASSQDADQESKSLSVPVSDFPMDNEADSASELSIPVSSSSSSNSPPLSAAPQPPTNSDAARPISILASAKDGKDGKRKFRVTFAEEPVESSFSPEPEDADDISSSTQYAEEVEDETVVAKSEEEEGVLADSTSQKEGQDDGSSSSLKSDPDIDHSDVADLIQDPITSLASELLSEWSGLKEVFKIPKKERVEERKRTERELDVLSKKEPGTADPYAKWKRKTTARAARKRIFIEDEEKKTNVPKLTKEERRQQFEAKIKAEDEMAAQAAAEELQRQQEAYMLHERLMEDPQYYFYHQQKQQDANFVPPPQEPVIDPATGQPVIDPATGQPVVMAVGVEHQPYFVDPLAPDGQQTFDPHTGQPIYPQHPVEAVDPQTGEPVAHHYGHHVDPHTGQLVHFDPVTGQPLVVDPSTGQPVHPDAPADAVDQSEVLPPAFHQSHQHPADPHQVPPPHHAILPPSTSQPPFHLPPSIDPLTGQPVDPVGPHPQHPEELFPFPGGQTLQSLLDPVIGQPIAQAHPQPAPGYQAKDQMSSGPVSTGFEIEDEVPPPPSPPTVPVTKLPPNWKTAKDAEGRVYYYHAFTRQTQWEMPNWDQNDDDSENDMDIDPIPLEDSFKQSKRKTTTAAADTSSELAKKIKEQFRCKMSGFIVLCLNPYRKPDCKVGRITSTEEFKHLARKLTHHVMSKELKHCRHVEDLEVNENVKAKAKDYVRKYMNKFGSLYRKEMEDTPA